MGGWMATALVVGNMIGSGVFLLPAALAAYGGISLLGWLFTAAGATVLALLFARLARLLPRSGGPYAYTRAAFGDFGGFLVAWGYWISIVVSNGALAIAMTSYLSWFLPVVGESRLVSTGIAVGTVWLLTAVNVSGARNAGGVQLLTTLLKVAPLLALGIFGLLRLDPSHFRPFNLSGGSPFGAVTAAATLTLFAFLGFESATVPAEEVKDAERTVPRATVAGTLFAALVYVVSTVGVMGVISPSELAVSGAPFGDAAGVLLGSWAGAIVSAGAVISCFGALNGWILLQGRIPFAAARDGLFPAVFGRLSARGTPATGLVLSSVLVTVFLCLNASEGMVRQFEFLVLLATLTALFPYALCAVAEPILRFRDPERFAAGRPSAVPWLALTGFAYALWAIAGAGMPTVYWGFLLLMLGVPVYGRMVSARGG
jgi:basic amino acid/polyamine antiporter, APA family